LGFAAFSPWKKVMARFEVACMEDAIVDRGYFFLLIVNDHPYPARSNLHWKQRERGAGMRSGNGTFNSQGASSRPFYINYTLFNLNFGKNKLVGSAFFSSYFVYKS
jgi:hypothetical protein